jgi:hypothetical protein
VHDAAGGWTFIRKFFEHWSRPLRDGDGCDEAEIRRAEQRLGIVLPEVLRDGYRLCGRRDDLRRQMRLLPPHRHLGGLRRARRTSGCHELRLDADGKVLVYQEGWYACARCRTKAALTWLHETLPGEWAVHPGG